MSLNVADVDEAVRFYTERLGFTVRTDRPDLGIGGAWLDVGDQQVHLINAPTPPSQGQHFALLVADLDAAISELRDAGVNISDAMPVGSARQAFVNDPSGNTIELHQRNG